MFSPADRDRVRDFVLDLAGRDPRVVAGAAVGSLAVGPGDRWSDLDLTFAVADGAAPGDVLEAWTREIVSGFDASHLFDLPAGPSIYRVFLLPGCLQFDLSFTPAGQFGALGPKFRLLFGAAVDRPHAQPPPARELLGYAVHHAVRARFCIERGRLWQAEYWISGVRDYALALACRGRYLPAMHGRGFDDLPAAVVDPFRAALVRSLDRDELLRALTAAVGQLIAVGAATALLAPPLEALLRQVTAEL